MVLSNAERQARYRAQARARAALVEAWTASREGLLQQLDTLERGLMRTRTNNLDHTAVSLERVRKYISDYDALIAKLEES